MIPVTKPYLPSREKLEDYVDGIYERKWLTNNGPLVQELTKRLEKYLGVENLLLVSNGTLALQIAYRTLGVNKVVNGKSAEAITTPFSFIATASSLKWEGINPVFVDIDPETWCLDPNNIESAITPQTRAIIPVHVFGNPCDVEFIQDIADKHDLKIIYDAAHAFDVKYKEQSILKYGDASILSLHATKLFHSIEGGAIIFKRREDLEKAKKLINFGISSPDCIDELGINAKMGEFNAAMGLCVLDEIQNVKEKRRNIWDTYNHTLDKIIVKQKWSDHSINNYAYFPIVLPSEKDVLNLMQDLASENIQVRRYFHPSLESVKVLGDYAELPVSQSISSKVLCLPLYPDLNVKDVLPSLQKYLGQFAIVDLKDLPDEKIVEFIQDMDKYFSPSMSERVNLIEYVRKLKEKGIILGTYNKKYKVTSLIGFYANNSDSQISFISYLAVDPLYKGRQIATKLILEAMRRSAENGMKKCVVSTWAENKEALNLYNKSGFYESDLNNNNGRLTIYLEAKI